MVKISPKERERYAVYYECNFTPSKFDREMIYFAKILALKSNVKGKHGSVLVNSNGTVESIGINYHNPDGRYEHRSSVHAESAALRNCEIKELCKYKLYVARSSQTCVGHTFSRPCNRCMKEIVEKKVGQIIYSNGGINEWEFPKMSLINIVYNL